MHLPLLDTWDEVMVEPTEDQPSDEEEEDSDPEEADPEDAEWGGLI